VIPEGFKGTTLVLRAADARERADLAAVVRTGSLTCPLQRVIP
jgi:hypothetical protein